MKRSAVKNGRPHLTPRERDLLRSLAAGFDYGQVARELKISYETVRSHAGRLRKKLKARSRADLVLWAVANGFSTRGEPDGLDTP